MIEKNQDISEKIKGNAISAYLMLFISGLFLFNKSNPDINNDFVKSHTKTAMLIHFGFLITYIIFISNALFAGYNIFGFGINNIITDIIYIFLLILLITGIYKAKNGETFNISKNLNISKSKNILDIDGNGKITEKEKITIILSYIPFIGYFIYGKYQNNKVIQDAVRLNIIISLTIILLFIYSYNNLATLFSLAYIIFISFVGITLFGIEELITISLPEILSPTKLYINIIVLSKYIKNYFYSKNFKTFSNIKKEFLEKSEIKLLENEKDLKTKNDIKIPKFLIYIPFINLIFLFFKNSKYSFHIINGIIITLISIIILTLNLFGYININLIILLLFPIMFGIGNLNYKLAYKIPLFFDIYLLFKKIISIFKTSKKVIKEKKAEEKEVSLKPKEV